MSLREQLARHLGDDFTQVDADRLSRYGTHRRGKVRDVFVGEETMVMVTSDRLSAFDVILTSIPCKGAILNAIAVEAFRATADVCPNHLLETPHPNVMVVRKARLLPVEMVVRRYVSGSLWRDYQAGRHGVYEVPLPATVRRDQRLDAPIVTPSTKAELGVHDEPVSRRAIIERGLVTGGLFDRASELALALFARGEEIAARRGLILVDTKYEFGVIGDELTVVDEIHTADSSRYWVAAEYQARFDAGEPQRMLDKENIRQWLIARGYQGSGPPPPIPDEVRLDLAETYARLHELLLGRAYPPPPQPPQATMYAALGA